METLNFKAESALLKQFFNTDESRLVQGLEGSRLLTNVFCRHNGFQRNTILCKSIDHLWANVEFRKAYNYIVDLVDLIDSVKSGRAHDGKEFSLIELVYDIISFLEEDELNDTHFTLLIEAAEALKKELIGKYLDKGGMEEQIAYEEQCTDMLIKDFRALAIISRCAIESNAVIERQNEALIDFFDPNKDKRKPLKKAA